MKLKTKLTLALALLVAAFLTMSCGSSKPSFNLANATTLQTAINLISVNFPIPIAGQNVVVLFAGDDWEATSNGAPALMGKAVFTETPSGANIEMEQTHIYSTELNPVTKKPVGWIGASTGAKIKLVYTSDPASLALE
jgi:hypothetical protein